jgi:hypothetical protein
MKKLSQRQRTRAAYGELDEIVVQLFDDLAAGDDLPESAVSSPMRGVSSQRSSRRPIHRSVPTSTVDSAQRFDLDARPTRNHTPQSQPNGSTPRTSVPEEFDMEPLFADESRSSDAAESLTREEEKFIEDVVSWLAPRPNAGLLLERMEENLWLNSVAALRQDAVEEGREDETVAPPTTAEEKPAPGEK